MGFVIQSSSQGRGIDEIPVVRHADAVRTIDVERLGLSVGTAASSWVSQVTEAHEAGQIRYSSSLLEDFGGEPVALALVKATASTTGNDTGLNLRMS